MKLKQRSASSFQNDNLVMCNKPDIYFNTVHLEVTLAKACVLPLDYQCHN